MGIEKPKDYELCHVDDLKPGQILYEDILQNKQILMKRGGMLTDKIISILKRRNIQYVYIVKEQPRTKERYSNIKKGRFQSKDFEEEFYETLRLVGSESRYGKILRNKEEVLYVKDLFVEFMKNPVLCHHWLMIKEYDDYTYRHSMDVFILGTLFCLKAEFENVEDIALGYLFHDIGKLTIPKQILTKNGRLTKKEFLIVQNHTVNGYNRFKKMNLEKLAYIARSHHERMDGSGYPDGLKGDEMPIELQLLHIIDSYSALTLRKPYKEIVPSYAALSILYNDVHLYNNELLNQFIDFIGIYPEGAHVLLSDGKEAIVDKVYPNFPLLPELKLYPNNEKMMLPTNLSVTIQTILSYEMNSPKDIFANFTEYLLEGNTVQMESYHNKLKNYYQKFEWFTHIYIPTFQLLDIWKSHNVYSKEKLLQAEQNLLKLINDTLIEFRISNEFKEKALIVLNAPCESEFLPKLFQGLLFSEEIASHVMKYDYNEPEIELKIKAHQFHHLIVIGETLMNEFARKINKYNLSEIQVCAFIRKFACTNLRKYNLINEIEKYKLKDSLVYSLTKA